MTFRDLLIKIQFQTLWSMSSWHVCNQGDAVGSTWIWNFEPMRRRYVTRTSDDVRQASLCARGGRNRFGCSCKQGVTTLRTPWSWQKYCLNHCARTCCSLRNVTRCRFTNWRIRCERGGRNVHFLSINLVSFRRSRGIVLVKLRVFRSRPNQHRHRQRHRQSASSLVRCLWLARLVSVWKAPPGDVTARSE